MEDLKKDLATLALEFQELIQCPVCLESLDDSSVVCLNGHGVCGRCKGEVTQCPTCAAEILEQKATLLCQMLEKVPRPCPFTDKGCSDIMISKDHQSYCPYRPVDCKLLGCEWGGCLRDLVSHVRASHKGNYFERKDLSSEYNLSHTINKSTSYGPFYFPLIFKTHFFWVWVHRYQRLKRLINRLYYLPESKPIEDYYLIACFKKGELEFKSISKASVNLDNADRVIDDYDNGLVISDELIDLFLEENETNKYSCTYKIIKKDITFGKH